MLSKTSGCLIQLNKNCHYKMIERYMQGYKNTLILDFCLNHFKKLPFFLYASLVVPSPFNLCIYLSHIPQKATLHTKLITKHLMSLDITKRHKSEFPWKDAFCFPFLKKKPRDAYAVYCTEAVAHRKNFQKRSLFNISYGSSCNIWVHSHFP